MEIMNEYYYLMCMHGRYPDVLAGDMGNEYFIGKFSSLDDMIDFAASRASSSFLDCGLKNIKEKEFFSSLNILSFHAEYFINS